MELKVIEYGYQMVLIDFFRKYPDDVPFCSAKNEQDAKNIIFEVVKDWCAYNLPFGPIQPRHIPVKENKDYDVVDLGGKRIFRKYVDQEIKVQNIAKDKNIKYCYMGYFDPSYRHRGAYYCNAKNNDYSKNYNIETPLGLHDIDIHLKEDAIKYYMSNPEYLDVVPILDINKHNEMIRAQITKLSQKLI